MSVSRLLLFGFCASAVVGSILYFTLSEDPPKPQSTSSDVPVGSKIVPAEMPRPLPIALQDSKQATPVDVNRLVYNKESFKAAELPERLAAMSLRRKGRVFNPEEVAAALQSDVAWTVDPFVADRLPVSKEERRDGREFIRVNPLKFEALMPGDEISITLRAVKPDGALRMVVDRVDDGLDGNITWHGHLKDFETDNQVSFTRGESLIVGGVTAPDKNYVVQIYGDVGWVVNGFTLFKGRHDAIAPPSGGKP